MDPNYYSQVLDQLSCDKCCDYCFIKEILKSIKPSVDLLIQLKCIEKFKWEESERSKHDIGWNNACFLWAERGYASKFRSLYRKDIDLEELYSIIMNYE